MATNNALNTPLASQTGTGNFAGSISANFTTPILGVATATSIQFTPATSGIVGTPTNNNVVTGSVGEFVSSQILFASAVTMSTTVAINLTSISLGAGDWDVQGDIFMQTTAPSFSFAAQISTVSLTLTEASFFATYTSTANTPFCGSKLPYRRMSLSGTTTIYLVVAANFASGVTKSSGGLQARRVR